MRLLTGPRWMLGMADVEALARRARELAADGGTASEAGRALRGTDGDRARARLAAAIAGAVGGEDIDAPSLIDAIDDPGPPARYFVSGLPPDHPVRRRTRAAPGDGCTSHCRT